MSSCPACYGGPVLAPLRHSFPRQPQSRQTDDGYVEAHGIADDGRKERRGVAQWKLPAIAKGENDFHAIETHARTADHFLFDVFLASNQA